jgi:hypothetical protein
VPQNEKVGFDLNIRERNDLTAKQQKYPSFIKANILKKMNKETKADKA